MLNKQHTIYGLMLSMGLGINMPSAHALNCRVIAEMDNTEALEQVGILRVSQDKAHQWASQTNRQLCAHDVVIVPKTLPNLVINYYSTPMHQQILTAGETHEVMALNDPCGALCKFQTAIKSFWTKLWNTESSSPSVPTGWRKAWLNQSKYVFTPLADGAGSSEPFHLFATEGAIPIFWQGGKAPYRLTVKDATGKVVVSQESIATGEFSFTVPNTKPKSVYTLTIQSSENQACQKTNSKICDKQLIFTLPPFPLDSAEQNLTLAKLWADCDRNWRLEMWRQLHTMPDSQAKRAFIAHLETADVSPFDQKIGFCQ